MKTPKFLLQSLLVYSLFFFTILSAQEIGAVRYLGHLIPPQGGSYIAGCWGWTDTTSGREYALLGSYCGTSIVEITNTSSLVERDFIPSVCSSWKELQTYQNYAYVVSEGGNGVQIIDLSYLPDSAHLVKNYIYTNGSKNTERAHTIHIKDGYMYLNGCANWSPGGILIFSLADPINPAFVGEWGGNYIHDCFVRNDTIYGAAIYGQGMQMINATNKSNPQLITTINYSGSGTHNTATTSDGRYVMTTDEIGSTAKTLKIWDLTSPPTFPKVFEYVGSPTAIVHNVFVKGDLAIMSYYTAGMRVLDISDPENPVEVGGYDTYPSGDPTAYDGAWSTYPFFPSGKIIIGDMSSGLYVVDINLNGPKSPTSFSAYSDYQTPNSINLNWNDPTAFGNGTPLTNFKIHIFRNNTLIAEVDSGVENYVDNSLTNHQFYTYTINAVSGSDSSTIVTAGAYAGGHATPNMPTSFHASDNESGVLLSWVNPSRQMDNTPLNDLAYILIYRDGVLVDSMSQSSADSGQSRQYLDSTVGYHSYYIKARDNETPVHYSAATSTIMAYGSAALSLSETFESSISAYEHTGSWDVSPGGATGSQSLTDSPFSNYSNNSSSYIVFSPVILGNKPMLRFTHAAIVAFGDFAFVEISKDQRQTYTALKVYNMTMHSEWQDGTLNSNDWITEQIDLSAYANNTVYVRFRLTTNSSNNADGWYIDDLYIGPSQYPATVALNTTTEWNLVSLPLTVSDKSVSTLFPTASSNAFSYSGGYQTAESLKAGKGYWLKFDSSQTIEFNGTTLLKDTFNVDAKWNIIGSLFQPIGTSHITSVPSGIVQSSYFGFDGSYQATTTIQPGKAYWVKTSQAGKLIFSAFSKSNPATSATTLQLNQMNSITIKNEAGYSQTLYFGASKNTAETMLEQYELPPTPPAGAFDARFSSQRYAELANEEQELFPLLVQSKSKTVTLEWNLADKTASSGWILQTGNSSLPMTKRGNATALISDRLALRYTGATPHSGEPKEFSLAQNYPNPFNPTTTIGFTVSEPAFVTLKVYNMLGEEVLNVVQEHFEAGSYSRIVDASMLPSGVYTYRLNAGTFTEVKKMTVLK